MECDWTFSWLPLHVHFRWRVAIIGEFFYWALLTPLWDPLSVQGLYRETTLRRGRDYEKGQCVSFILSLRNIFVKNILYKRIVTKFFWDYYLNSRVCNYGKRVLIGLLQLVIKRFIFIF